MGGGTQTEHAKWHTVNDIQQALGVSSEDAQDFYDAVNGGRDGGFTRGWDTAIRAYQQGMSPDEVIDASDARDVVASKYNGDKDAYIRDVAKKAKDCERLIDASPKWNGSELMRGFHDMPQDAIDALTDPNAMINLNAGTASWTTSEGVASVFAETYANPKQGLIAHVRGDGGMRATSIEGISAFNHYDDGNEGSEWEVLASQKNAYRCVRTWYDPDGTTHAEYEVVSTNHNWKKKK